MRTRVLSLLMRPMSPPLASWTMVAVVSIAAEALVVSALPGAARRPARALGLSAGAIELAASAEPLLRATRQAGGNGERH